MRLPTSSGSLDFTGEVTGTAEALEAYRKLDRASGRTLPPGPTHVFARAQNEKEFTRISAEASKRCEGLDAGRCQRMIERCHLWAGKTAQALMDCLSRGLTDAD